MNWLREILPIMTRILAIGSQYVNLTRKLRKKYSLPLQNEGYVGYNVSKYENTCKKGTRKTPERQFLLIQKRQIFEIYTLMLTMVISKGDAKVHKLSAQPNKLWIKHCFFYFCTKPLWKNKLRTTLNGVRCC